MSMTKRGDGGQAFPCEQTIGDTSKHLVKGMSLRDYFAAKAMQAMIANNWPIIAEDGEALARTAYGISNVMLAARGESK